MTKTAQKLTLDQKIIETLKKMNFYKTPDNSLYSPPDNTYKYKVIQTASAEFIGRVRKEFYDKHGIILKDKAIEQALTIMAYDANRHKKVDRIFTRFGYCGDDLYIDLQENNNRVVKIDSFEWTTCCDCPILFETFPGQKEISPPSHNGSFDHIKYFLKSEHIEDDILLYSTICTLPFSNITRPILGFVGPQGSGKSTAARMIRMIFDPSMNIFNSSKQTEHDFSIMMSSNALPILDNLSNISQSMSGMMCQAITDFGFQTRTLYTNKDYIQFNFKKPFIYTAINQPTTAKDFLDRTIIVEFDRLAASERVSENKFETDVMEYCPSILGGILDIVVEIKKLLTNLKIKSNLRLTDFGLHAAAASEILGYGADSFIEAALERQNKYLNRKDVESIEEPLADTIIDFLSKGNELNDSASGILKKLNSFTDNCNIQNRQWPDSAEKFGKSLGRIKSVLEDAGVTYYKSRGKGGSNYMFTYQSINTWDESYDYSKDEQAYVPISQEFDPDSDIIM